MRKHVAPPPRAPLPEAARPTFSIMIPAYQAAATIPEAIDSALSQTVLAHEVIVCDDGSTDGLREALGPWVERVRLLRKDNGGGASALNAAARAASGEFVVVLDADDAYLPERIEALEELARARPDLDLITTDAYFEADGRRAGRFNQANPFAGDDQSKAILERCFIGWPAIRRRRLLEIGGFDEALRIGYDWDCWIRLIRSGALAGLVDEPLMLYRLTPGSLAADRVAAFRERVTLLEKVRTHPELRPEERRVLERSLATHRRRALRAEAIAALDAGDPTARQRALAVAVGPGFGLGTRARAVAAAAAPGVTGRWLARRAARQGGAPLARRGADG
jgi:hypothetical protein